MSSDSTAWEPLWDVRTSASHVSSISEVTRASRGDDLQAPGQRKYRSDLIDLLFDTKSVNVKTVSKSICRYNLIKYKIEIRFLHRLKQLLIIIQVVD